MSRETERIMKELQKRMENMEFADEAEANREMLKIVEEYNAGLGSPNKVYGLSADDFLDKAYEAETTEECLKYAKKALKLDSNCIDAKLLIIQNEVDEAEDARKELEDVLKRETKRLEKEGYFDKESIGHFYGMLETRPYMRVRHTYIDLLVEMGKYRKAISECEDLIQLNENDNMGVRYRLMTLYAALEELDGAKTLYAKFKEDSCSMLYPLAILYYRLDDYNKAKSMLKKIVSRNKDFQDFITDKMTLSDDEINEILHAGTYQPYTIEETLLVFRDNSIMLDAMSSFNSWARRELLKKQI